MLYSKDDKKYTTMCKEFDEEFYSGHRDDDKLFKYMYLVFYMLACKSNYFTKFEYYDKYAQYAATTIYNRYLKKEKKGVHIKSLLNYAKSCKGHLKTDFQKEEFQQVSNKEDENASAYSTTYRQMIEDYCCNEDLVRDTEDMLSNIKLVFKEVLSESPFKNNALLMKNIYTSCLLTMISSITLNNEFLEKLENKMSKKTVDSEYIIKQFQRERQSEPILWNLDDSYSQIISLLVNKVRIKMSDELNSIRSSYTLPDDIIDSIIANSIKESHYDVGDSEAYLDD